MVMVRSAMPGSVAIGMCARAVVEDVLVDLVGDREDVVLAGTGRDDLELGAREDLARRVVRRVDDDGARAAR